MNDDVALWTIVNDDPARLRELRDMQGLEMPFLLDPEAEVIAAYGVANEEDDRSIPHPTALIIDREGTVRYVRIDVNYRERPSIEELTAALAEIE